MICNFSELLISYSISHLVDIITSNESPTRYDGLCGQVPQR